MTRKREPTEEEIEYLKEKIKNIVEQQRQLLNKVPESLRDWPISGPKKGETGREHTVAAAQRRAKDVQNQYQEIDAGESEWTQRELNIKEVVDAIGNFYRTEDAFRDVVRGHVDLTEVEIWKFRLDELADKAERFGLDVYREPQRGRG